MLSAKEAKKESKLNESDENICTRFRTFSKMK
jgi:hypothetical protein